MVSGEYLLGDPVVATGTIRAHDSGGEEVLSYVPHSAVPAFLSKSGQSFVSFANTSSTSTNVSNDPR